VVRITCRHYLQVAYSYLFQRTTKNCNWSISSILFHTLMLTHPFMFGGLLQPLLCCFVLQYKQQATEVYPSSTELGSLIPRLLSLFLRLGLRPDTEKSAAGSGPNTHNLYMHSLAHPLTVFTSHCAIVVLRKEEQQTCTDQ